MYILTRENGNMLMDTNNRPVIFDTYSEAVKNRFGSFCNVERAD